jgi:hypothetical protein
MRGEHSLVVAHVLQHLDAHAAVERARREVQRVHVGGQQGHVGEAQLAQLLGDVEPLRRRVGHAREARVGEARRHEERERAPAEAQLEHALSVADARELHRLAQHRFLGGFERGDALGEVAARVLAVRPQHQLEEARRELVVLLVGGLGVHGDGPRAQPGQQLTEARVRGLAAPTALVAQALGAQRADAHANDGVRQQAALGGLDGRQGVALGHAQRGLDQLGGVHHRVTSAWSSGRNWARRLPGFANSSCTFERRRSSKPPSQ